MFSGNVHIAKGSEADIAGVLSLLKKEGIETVGNPDLSVNTYKTFGIDEARELSGKAAARAVGARRVFLIGADTITHEAQNALLKTLEEAPGNALFIFLHPAPETLLPTIKSRAQFFTLAAAAHAQESIDAQAFLKATPAKRLDMLKPLLEKGDDDKRDLGVIIRFLSALEAELASQIEKASAREGIRAILRARNFLTDRGALVKPLLEQVALLI